MPYTACVFSDRLFTKKRNNFFLFARNVVVFRVALVLAIRSHGYAGHVTGD